MAQVDNRITAENAAWTFSGIADEFDEHVIKSVPLYEMGHDLVCKLSDFFLPENAVVTELGTSTGALAGKFLRHNAARGDIRYVAVDREEGMLELARQRCAEDPRVTFLNEDIVTYPIEKSTMVLSYFTLQFIPPRSRQDVYDRIYDALEWGGALVLFEKVRAPDARFQDIANQLYHEFKLDQGFDEVEILNKQRSLKGILEPFSTQGNIDMLRRAGFVDIMPMIKYVSFEGFLAIK